MSAQVSLKAILLEHTNLTKLASGPMVALAVSDSYSYTPDSAALLQHCSDMFCACNRCKLAAVIGKALTLLTERNAAAVSRVFKHSEVKEAVYQRLDFAEEHVVKRRVPRRQPSLEASDLMQHYPPISLQPASTGEPECTSPPVTYTVRSLAPGTIECTWMYSHLTS